MTQAQRKYLFSYDRKTLALSTYESRSCGYGDLLKIGFVSNRGSDQIPDLYITRLGIEYFSA
jgi:hypothetical protein